ncbi:hypothetical protein ACTQ6A_01060 [Lachnospiraceae bacterium LCP25S3_G4]
MIKNEELPIGFTMALAQNSNSLVTFSQMPQEKQQEVINGAKQMHSASEMRNFIDKLDKYS